MSDTTLRTRLALSIRDQNLAETYASRLRELGFRVMSVSSRGVNFEGSVDLLGKVFDSQVQISETDQRFATDPKLPAEISDYVDAVYFPTRPSFFD